MTGHLDIRPVLDCALSYDPASVDRGGIEAVRYLLANQIVTYAAQCRNNSQLLAGLMSALSPELGFEPPRLLGQGSTRSVWSLPFNLVMKLERADELSPQEMEYRGSRRYLDIRRNMSTFNEMLTSMVFPALGPEIYGVLLAFGRPRVNPAVLISERADIRGRRGADNVSVDDLFIDGETGHLKITDPLMNPEAVRAKPNDISFRIFQGGDESVHFSNFGRVDGRWVLLDLGNSYHTDVFMNSEKLLPVGLEKLGWTAPEKGSAIQQTLQLSQWMHQRYLNERRTLWAVSNLTRVPTATK
jgi:hypothetical protein